MKGHSRREFLLATAAARVTAGLSAHAWPSRAFAQTAGSIAPSEWDYRTAKEIAGALQARKISAVELTDHVIARIEALDQKINAVVVRDFDRARDAAKAADAALGRGERRPLLGVPITIKESFNVAGLPTTWGIVAAKGFVPQEDALTVARLKGAGAVVLGKDQCAADARRLAELQRHLRHHQQSVGSRPHAGRFVRRLRGGAGCRLRPAVARLRYRRLAARAAELLRRLRPQTHARHHSDARACAARRPGGAARHRSCGRRAEARSASDLALELDILAGPDELRDAVAYRLALPPPRHEALKDFRVLVVDTHPLLPTGASVRAALEKLSDRLGKAGVTVARESPLLPDFAEAARLYMRLLLPAFSASWPPEQYDQVKAAAAALPPDDNSLTAERVRSAVLSHRDWMAADSARAGLRERWRRLFVEWDAVICPTMPTPPYPHDHSMPDYARKIDIDGKEYPYQDQLVWPGVATAPGLPATAAPIDRSDTGLPIGVQVVGPYLEDRTTIAFAELMEQEFGGFAPPPGYAG